jgi:hypothetical protein
MFWGRKKKLNSLHKVLLLSLSLFVVVVVFFWGGWVGGSFRKERLIVKKRVGEGGNARVWGCGRG